ncbi:uncharacterized protein F5Z01DRAFT_323416 [Emericellopsis atlantica]|uniref:Uncharacterized protein n=1 Tax=Emericellopsis atlantica TaxID=2614577 RepID=A0A9P8CVI3_9HYPO|nr:uncharacterized protein F5Z01DRAFT_323416 [Emericellopsis atlantica]KAG9258196.1 hypothetical protein F5Z01DRAFT_323416 [Emericellopsis atlantica]
MGHPAQMQPTPPCWVLLDAQTVLALDCQTQLKFVSRCVAADRRSDCVAATYLGERTWKDWCASRSTPNWIRAACQEPRHRVRIGQCHEHALLDAISRSSRATSYQSPCDLSSPVVEVESLSALARSFPGFVDGENELDTL